MQGHPWAWGNVNGTMNQPRTRFVDGRIIRNVPRIRRYQSVYDLIPESYEGALEALRGKSRRSLGYATHLEDGDGAVYLVHHSTAIVKYLEDGSVIIRTGGWHSVTTKARINAALGESTWRIWADGRGGWAWYRQGAGRFCEFRDGDRVFLEPGVPGQDGIFFRPDEVA